MRYILSLFLLIVPFVSPLAQSFSTFLALDSCANWQCVMTLVGDHSLRLDRSIPWRLPVRSTARLSSGYGYRMHPIKGKRKFHAGVDLAAKLGSPVFAAAAGLVTTGQNRLLGNFVKIDHLNGFTSTYGHLDLIIVNSDELIPQGHPIGSVGTTGQSTGPHLHWVVSYRGKSMDPLVLRQAFIDSF